VFVDDNPAERALVEDQLPEVAVPEMGSDVSRFAEVLEQQRYFEVHALVQDDLNRADYYASNAQRSSSQNSFQDYGEFLASLEMTAEIGPFAQVYLERITQLINKTNQFNLTTRRCTVAEMESVSKDPNYIALWGRLSDKFGDNGLVTVLIGKMENGVVEIEVWLMSCRVFHREMELAMFDAFIELCQARGIKKIVGQYIPTKKNAIVAEHYANLGFTRVTATAERVENWTLDVPGDYAPKAKHIRRSSAADLVSER